MRTILPASKLWACFAHFADALSDAASCQRQVDWWFHCNASVLLDACFFNWTFLTDADARITYTYDVSWDMSTVGWASRWDAYLRMPGGRVHWFSILNSLMVVLVMSSIVAMIMMRTIRRDLARYEGLLGDTGGALPQDCCACQGPQASLQVKSHAASRAGSRTLLTPFQQAVPEAVTTPVARKWLVLIKP